MSRHDEPNEYGFAGGATAPEPPAGGRADEQDRAEQVAVPGDDLTEPVTDALEETEDGDGARRAGRR
ncbi:hypothetical protein O7602_12725 [Micromonospora sp. WMMD1128]|uniref:hypothetical protein n=1 Tax=unclassified Micromonospora TaxID=2617518 RepID=UPI00248C1432|nr:MULTISPECIES: hypothetical protein [unclassified Micromonospora]WBB76334.1 hypothetical protein O7602_12725 [Micromonospora sp. WMMD1128]WFE35881.1 hypothetical protein O7613_11030 [Micromonospora sp. WMMD975]